MKQPPNTITPWPAADCRWDPASCPPLRLLKGRCSLIFEGQSFVPDGGARKEYWLRLPDEMRKRLMEPLALLGWQNEMEPFEAEFYGTLSWVGEGCGHLGTFGGTARMLEIVSVRFPVAMTHAPHLAVGIRARLKAMVPFTR